MPPPHPNNAKFISSKLARRFVADTPPAALVDRMTKTFLDTDGDIRAVLHTMIFSPGFWSRQTYRAKIKKPFELVASAARAQGAEATDRKSTRLISSHRCISYAVFCLKKKKKNTNYITQMDH